MASRPQAFFLPSDGDAGGQRFCLYHPPAVNSTLGLVLYVHPFAEEMNKSRRMAALQSRAFAKAGYAVLQIDLLGCGDSSGDFGDASWEAWVQDVVQGCQTLRRMAEVSTSQPPVQLWLWGLRAGCLLAVEAASKVEGPVNLLLWQPPASGKPLLQQFLRLKMAGDLLGGQTKGITENLRQQLVEGVPVEIAGYTLSPALAHGMDHAKLEYVAGASTQNIQRIEWVELSTREEATLSPVSAKTIAHWQGAGARIRSHVVKGPAFWQTTEIEEAPALLSTSIEAVSDWVAA
jgi:uncharacterized protein